MSNELPGDARATGARPQGDGRATRQKAPGPLTPEQRASPGASFHLPEALFCLVWPHLLPTALSLHEAVPDAA